MATTDKKLYFILVDDPTKQLYIQFVPPDLKINRSVSIQDIQVVGRNNPFYQYTGGAKTLSFQLDFYAEEESREDVIKSCEWLESLTYNNDGAIDSNGRELTNSEKRPSRIKLVYGNLFQDKNYLWIVKSLNYTLSRFNKEKGFLPQQAYVDITLALDTDNDYKQRDLIF
jgi:hypothetical protein